MISDKDIRTRFIECFYEIPGTVNEKAQSINTSKQYISNLKTHPNPNIKGSILANFCYLYGYSPNYILLGQGPKKGEHNTNEIIVLFKEILRKIENRNTDSKIIHDLLQGMLELKSTWNTAHSKLVDKARRHNKS